ncbi:MAG: BamA/TamA family outer membrane protein [Bacteroidales bacterium]|jgi:hypothetical protein|nr:BamA/TamA family outer membrane protein [Bacteroidales bacterium]
MFNRIIHKELKFSFLTSKLFLILILLSTLGLKAQLSDTYSLLLTGNTSEGILDENLLEKWQSEAQNSNKLAFLMLGNIYNLGENKFSNLLLSNSNHPLLLAPGEKEWANGSSAGKGLIKDIEDKLKENYKGFAFMPDPACPGPKEVVLNEHLVVILIDSHWWVHKYDRRFNRCGIESTADVLVQIEDAIRRHYPSKHIVIAAHHSLKSYGNSDGYFSLQRSILEAPYTLYRKILGTRKDNHHPDFKAFRNAMLSILDKYPDVIYASAGDKNLQYFRLDNVHHLISGSIIQTEFVRKKGAEFSKAEKGYGRLNFSDDGDCELIFTGIDGELFRKTIYKKKFVSDIQPKVDKILQSDSVFIKASEKYNKPEAAYFWMGKNYREVWDTPIKAPVFDIGTKKEGLHVLKRGGGQQTLSLRLEDKNGKQYVLRSIEKEVEGALPFELKNTLAANIVQDQISASNPYAALVVAELAESVGIFHTNPEIVYIPDDPRFGIYQKDVANKLFLFEERPDENRSEIASFGYSKEIISTDEVIEKIFYDEDHFIDSQAILRARLFDILINDWDRHDDQWRWASFKNDGKTIYKPIPRDRDQAFFVNEGVFPWIAARKWLMPKIQGFDEYTEDVAGQYSYITRYFDQTFLIHSSWKDWQEQIDSLKMRLSSENINQAVLSFPKEVQMPYANRTAEVLKARLQNLEPMAKQLYLSLAKEVDITGTNEKDIFDINVLSDSSIQIVAYHIKKNKEKGAEIYNRVFYASETKNIRIYGFDKKDKFVVKGNNKSKIDLSIIGGGDKDEVTFKEKKIPGFISIYDIGKADLSNSVKKRIKHNYDKEELKYNREVFENDVLYPVLFVGYNQDDGVFLGGGADIHKYSRFYRKNYQFLANYGLSTSAVNLHFEGKRTNLLKRLEFDLIADFKSPTYVNNYFGMGNETNWLVDKSEKEYYRVRMGEYFAKVNFVKLLDKNGIHKAGLGMSYKNTEVEATADRFISDSDLNNLNPSALLPHAYAGLSFKYEMNTMIQQNSKNEVAFFGSNMFPTRGMQLKTELSQYVGLNEDSPDFTKIVGEWTSYFSFSQRPRIVYAVRLGGEKVFGEYVFNEAAKLGQNDNLRGYRLTRFYGDASFYLNTEIRIRAKQFNTYILNGTAGLLLFNDVGRVWYSEESSTRWHDGYGIGFWMSPFDMAIITISYAGSKEDNLINFNLKYQF